ncbi:hypothetical protein EJB05_57691, partial [Eragrostis curvula]
MAMHGRVPDGVEVRTDGHGPEAGGLDLYFAQGLQNPRDGPGRALAQPTATPSRSSSLLRDGEAMGITTVAGVDPVISTAPGLDSPSIMLQGPYPSSWNWLKSSHHVAA